MIDLFKKIIGDYQESDWEISLSLVEKRSSKYCFLNGQDEDFNKDVDIGAMISVGRRGKCFRHGTSSISYTNIKRIINYSIENYLILENYFLPDQSTPLMSDEVYDVSRAGDIDQEKILSIIKESSHKNHAWLENLRSSITQTFEKRIIVNSAGGSYVDEKYYTNYFLELTGTRKGVTQSRSNGGVIFQGEVDNAFLSSISAKRARMIDELDQLLSAPACPIFNGSLLLPPDQMYIQIHESIGHPLELDRILGDERNYAGGSFVNKSDFGKLKYGPEMMNVVFAPDEKLQPVGVKFDDTGCKAETKFLIKEGILEAGIGGLESQRRLNVNGSSSTRASSWNRPPIDRMGNINLLPGTSSFDEMVRTVENGIFMKTNRSWSIDDKRDKFQFGCELGYLIKDGEIKNIVRAPNYEGRTIPFWNSLSMLGDIRTQDDFGTSHCGKGEPNQAIRVGHRSPACLFSNISIFSGD